KPYAEGPIDTHRTFAAGFRRMIHDPATEGPGFDEAVAQVQRDWLDIGQAIATLQRALDDARSIHQQSHRAATLAQRSRIGAELCTWCGQEILRISDLAKGTLAAKVAVLHRRCYASLGQGPQKRAGHKPAR